MKKVSKRIGEEGKPSRTVQPSADAPAIPPDDTTAGSLERPPSGFEKPEGSAEGADAPQVPRKAPGDLRSHYVGVLRTIRSYFRRPSSMGGHPPLRSSAPVRTPALDQLPSTNEVRAKIAQGYLVQPPRQRGGRRSTDSVFMFRLSGDKIVDKITVEGDGSVHEGWVRSAQRAQ